MVSKNNNGLLRDYKKLKKKFNNLRNFSDKAITSNINNFFDFINNNENINPYFKDYLDTFEKFYISNQNNDEYFNPPVKDEDKLKYALGLLKQFSDEPIDNDEDILINMLMYTGYKNFQHAYERCFGVFIEEPFSNIFEDIEYDLREKDVTPMPQTINNFNGNVSQSQFGANSTQYNTIEDNSVTQEIENAGITLTLDNRKVINEIQNELNKEDINKDSLKGKCISLVTNGSKDLLSKTISTIANPILNNVGEEILSLFN
ncbi:hypothetical protein K4R44_03270 [Staphylococcus epidermidis]|nr:hypothetical protein [Staphylococcus epidermidis]